MDEERKGLSGYGDMVNIQHMHIKDSVTKEKGFISLDINMDKSIHWNMTSNARWSRLTIFLHGDDNEAQLQEIMAIAFASARGCKEE
jgi:hypothetical protein